MPHDTSTLQGALEATDALLVSEAAFRAGMMYVEAKMEAADLEGRRTLFRMEIRDDLIARGAKKTEAEDLARQNGDYLTYCVGVQAKEHERDRLEVLYNALRQRAWILGQREAAREALV
jgi:hypothetical protein